MRARLTLSIVLLGCALQSATASELGALFDAVPAPPAQVDAALAAWHDGQITLPAYQTYLAQLTAQRKALIAFNGGAAPVVGTQLASVSGDTPETMAALAAFRSYLSENTGEKAPMAAIQKRSRWISAAMGGSLKQLLSKMEPCAAPCTDAGILARNQPLLAKKRQLGEQELTLWASLFTDWKRGHSARITAADRALSAADDGRKALTPDGRAGIARYRAAMLDEIAALASITELAITRAAVIDSGDVDAVSSASRKGS